MKKMLLTLATGWLVAVALSACASPPEPEPVATPDPNQPVSSSDPTPTPEPTVNPGEYTFGEASVDSVDVVMLESFPLQVMVAVNGNLPDGCTEIYDSHVERTDNAFGATLTTARPTNAECTEALVPYQENIPLDVYGLPAGDYTVTVNGVSAGFTFAQDNGPLEDTVVVPPPGDETHMEINPALVNEVQVRTDGTASGGPELVIRGEFSDGCTSLHSITDTLSGLTVTVEVLVQRPTEMMCTQALVDFEETYPLTSVSQPGTYTVIVNGGVTAEFTLP